MKNSLVVPRNLRHCKTSEHGTHRGGVVVPPYADRVMCPNIESWLHNAIYVHIACVKYHSSGSRARVGGAPALRCAPVGAVRLRLQFTRGGGSLSRPAAARCPDRPALGAAPTATLRAGYCVRLARTVRACGATKRAIWRNRYAIVRATRRQITVWCSPLLGACAVPAWLSPQFLPALRGAAHLRAYARRAMRGESPRAPHPNKTHSWNRPGCIRIVPRDTTQQTGKQSHAGVPIWGGSPQPPVICPFDPANEYQQ